MTAAVAAAAAANPFASIVGSIGAGLGRGLGDAISGGGGGPMTSGGMTDLRSFMDGSGWTVSTGSSKATGGSRSGGNELGASSASPFQQQPQQAGAPWLMLLLAGGIAWAAFRTGS